METFATEFVTNGAAIPLITYAMITITNTLLAVILIQIEIVYNKQKIHIPILMPYLSII